MAEYIVKNKQNIFDVALELYGSISGVTDLLVCNPSLSYETELNSGDILQYTEGYKLNGLVYDKLRENNATPAHGYETYEFDERYTNKTMTAAFTLPPTPSEHILIIDGEGEMVIDWDDSLQMQHIALDGEKVIRHRYRRKVSHSRTVRLFLGGIKMNKLDYSLMGAEDFKMFEPVTLKEVVVDEKIDKTALGLINLRVKSPNVEPNTEDINE